MLRVRLIAPVALTFLAGCATYIKGELSFVDHPEIRQASLATDHHWSCGHPLGRIEKRRQGTEPCSDLAAAAVADLIAESKARGGDGVRGVQFRGRRRWHPGVLCRKVDGGLEVYTVGFAYSGCDEGR
jgi:hypothetical protein